MTERTIARTVGGLFERVKTLLAVPQDISLQLQEHSQMRNRTLDDNRRYWHGQYYPYLSREAKDWYKSAIIERGYPKVRR